MNRLSRYCDGLIEATWLLVIIVVPLHFLLSLEQPYGIGKTAMFRAIILVGGAAWIAKWIGAGLPRFEPKSMPALWAKITSQPLALLVGALATVYILSTAFSIAPLVSLRGSYTRFEGLGTLLSYIVLFALIATNLRRREQADRLITTLAAVNFAIDFYAIMQHFSLDPVSWSNLVTIRAVSTIGHPIFLAAFLGMSLVILLGRVVFLIQSYRQASTPPVTTLTLIGLYIIVCVLNLLSIWYTVARGSLIALFFGLFFLGFALLVYFQLRRTFYIFSSVGIVLLTFVAMLNIPNSPLAGLRDKPFVGPFGHIFDTETGTGLSRTLIWNGSMRLVTPHEPIQLPDHSVDRWNAIRPLIGYGPETIYLIYENYYLPKMFSIESYDLEHDHSHNEFWDVLAFYGVFGFLVEYGFFLSLIYFALKWLGWISSSMEHKLYWISSLIGGLLGGVAVFVTVGPEFLGLGIPLGLLLGVVVILLARIFRHTAILAPKPDPWRDIIIISSLALIVFHYVEILFGIPVLTSRILFWIACGAMLVMGQGALMLPEKTSGKNNMGMAKNSNVQPRSKGKSFKKSTEESTTFNLKQSGIHASIVMAIVMAMTPLFISTTQFGQSASAIVGDSLVANSASVLWMFLSVILFSSLIFELESAVLSSQKGFFPNLLFLLSTTLPASFLIWTIYASQVAAVWQSAEATSSEMVAQYLSMLGAQFGTLVIFMYAWATLLPESDNTRMPPTKPLAIASFGLINILALILSIYINLRPLQANGIAKLFNGYVSYSRYSDALNVGEHLLTLDPWQDVYFLGVADITTEYANTISDPQTKQETLLMAEEYYKQAYRLNPLYLRNLLGMAHINRTWAGLSQSLASREARVAQAEQFYAYMLNDKPYRVKLWVEWADFRREIGDIQGARQRIDTALKIDNTYAPANQFSTDLYLSESQK